MGNDRASGSTHRRYSREEKARAVRAVRQLRKELGASHGTIQRVADQIGCGAEAVWALWLATRKVYGARKLWKAAGRAGHDIGRDQVARLMRELDIRGVSRRRTTVFTTRADPDRGRAPDLVNRVFRADRPDGLWVT